MVYWFKNAFSKHASHPIWKSAPREDQVHTEYFTVGGKEGTLPSVLQVSKNSFLQGMMICLSPGPTCVLSRALSSCPPYFTGLKDPIRVQSLHMAPKVMAGPQPASIITSQAANKTSRTQADISFTKLSGASWPHLLETKCQETLAGPPSPQD